MLWDIIVYRYTDMLKAEHKSSIEQQVHIEVFYIYVILGEKLIIKVTDNS